MIVGTMEDKPRGFLICSCQVWIDTITGFINGVWWFGTFLSVMFSDMKNIDRNNVYLMSFESEQLQTTN